MVFVHNAKSIYSSNMALGLDSTLDHPQHGPMQKRPEFGAPSLTSRIATGIDPCYTPARAYGMWTGADVQISLFIAVNILRQAKAARLS